MIEELNEAKKIIGDAKNIYIIPSEINIHESVACALALFYTLKEFNKNVNLIINDIPERLKFLIPSLDFISLPKNFVISIPGEKADVSQIYYEKNNDGLKIHLSLSSGNIKKDDISFYFSEARPDVIIALGIKDFSSHLIKRLNFYGFLMGSPIINIDNNYLLSENNKRFGRVNLLKDSSLAETIIELISSIDATLIKKEAAACLLAALMIFSENFKSEKTSPAIFDIASFLIKKGADRGQITNELYKTKSPSEIKFLTQIFKNLNTEDLPAQAGNKKISYAIINSENFQNFGEEEADFAVNCIKTSPLAPDNLLVLWKSHESLQRVNGFFYSESKELFNNILKIYQGNLKNNWMFLSIENSDLEQVKNKIINSL
ncbi:MAG: hypothetical protein AAB361_00475 [Patescibacteria group bacterium]